jgi:hypothetical protein
VRNQAQAAQSGYNPATAKTVAGFTPEQLQAFANISGNQGIWNPALSSAQGMVEGAGAGIGAADISKFFNPYQQDVIDATMQDVRDADALQMRNYTANQAAQNALGGNGFFVGRAQLEGNQTKARNSTLANLRSSGWDKALAAAQMDKTRGLEAGRSMATIGQLLQNLSAADAAQFLASGNQQQQQQQAVNDAASQNALNEQLWPMQQAQWAASLASGIGPLMGGTTTSQGSATQSQGKGVGNVVGGALTLASMASDERVKEDVREIGRSHDGQPIYAFRYKGDPRTQIGLMAQDVEQEHPEAVSEIGGIKHVNYDQALEGAEPRASWEREAAADGGIMGLSTGMPAGLMPWAELRPATPRWPDAPDVRAPAQQQDPMADWEQMAALGKKAGAGIGNIGRMLDPAGGWGAEIVPTASLSAGGAGGLSSLFSMFGFADGGAVDPLQPTEEEMRALEMVESGGRDILGPVTRSGGRAFGPRQIMPATAKEPGFGVRPLDQTITEPKARLAEQRRFSDDYYAAMLRRYSGDREAARIAYNGGPARADAWLAAGRDDSVIPRESADYYKKIAGRLGTGGDVIVAKAVSPQASEAAGGGEPYRSKGDRATGGFIKRIFGVDFNPLGLTEPERKALLVAGLSMMSSGDVGRGGLAGMAYLSGVEASEREAAGERAKLAYQRAKDEREFGLRERTADREDAQFGYQREKDARTEGREDIKLGLELDKFNQNTKSEEAKLAWEREKQALDAGKPSEDMKEYSSYVQQELAAGRTPRNFFDYQVDLKKAGRPETNVTVGGEKKGAEEMAKLHAKQYDTLRTNAAGADQMIDNLDNVERAINTAIQTGFAGEGLQWARRLGHALGITEASDAAAGEVINMISNRLALMVRAPGGDASGGMPGAMSDADRMFLKETVPGLLKTPEGNRQVLAIMRTAAERHRALFDMAVDYAQEHGGQLDAGFDRMVRDYVKANPLSAAVKRTQDTPRPVSTETIKPSSGFRILGVQ